MEPIQAPSVFGWAADQTGCGYYRIGLPFRTLQQQYGMKCIASLKLEDVYQKEADVIVGQRICMEGPSGLWQNLYRDGRRLVFEVDDDLWHIHPSNEKPYEFFTKEMTGRLTDNCGVANLVTVTSEQLAEVVRPINPNVVIIPNYIDAALIEHERTRRDKLTLGWSGSFTHHMDFDIAAGPLRQFFARNPNLDMHFIGHNYSDKIRKEAIFTDWSMEVIEYQMGIDFDIGIIPLRNQEFNRSKSYIKALEYAALGIPVVMSNVGPYRDFGVHGETCFKVTHDWEWKKYLNILVNDADVRESMGRAAREYARDFTIQKNSIKWLQLFAGMMKDE